MFHIIAFQSILNSHYITLEILMAVVVQKRILIHLILGKEIVRKENPINHGKIIYFEDEIIIYCHARPFLPARLYNFHQSDF
jgi:hypothetical protein